MNCFATRDLMERTYKVGFMYREVGDDEKDSGWRFFSGTESQEYVDNPDNLIYCTLDDVVKVDEFVARFLNNPVNTAYERIPETNNFAEVKDFFN